MNDELPPNSNLARWGAVFGGAGLLAVAVVVGIVLFYVALLLFAGYGARGL